MKDPWVHVVNLVFEKANKETFSFILPPKEDHKWVNHILQFLTYTETEISRQAFFSEDAK